MSFENVTIFREDTGEMELEVHFHYYAGCSGLRDGYGAPETPDDAEELNLEEVYHAATGEEITLTKEEEKEVEQKLWDIVRENCVGRGW